MPELHHTVLLIPPPSPSWSGRRVDNNETSALLGTVKPCHQRRSVRIVLAITIALGTAVSTIAALFANRAPTPSSSPTTPPGHPNATDATPAPPAPPTPPAPHTDGDKLAISHVAMNFLVVGDFGWDGGWEQVPVAEQMARTAGYVGTNFVVSVGDNFYSDGVGSTSSHHWSDSWVNVYREPDVPWYCVLGNHDYHKSPQPELDYHGVNVKWNMPSRYYSKVYDVNNVKVCIAYLDTNPFAPDNYANERITGNLYGAGATPDDPAQAQWLDQTLYDFTGWGCRWSFVVGHHSIHTGGSHGDTKGMVNVIKPILLKHRIPIYFNGHDHTMQHVSRDGLAMFVNGAGAQPEPPPQWVEGTRFALGNVAGFTSVAVSNTQVDVQFVSRYGEVLYQTVVDHN